MTAITAAGFDVFEPLQAIPGSNVPKNKRYVRMALLAGGAVQCTGRVGVLDTLWKLKVERSALAAQKH